MPISEEVELGVQVRKFFPFPSIQLSPKGSWINCGILHEVKQHSSRYALISDLSGPTRVHSAEACARFATDKNQVNVRHVNCTHRSEKRFKHDEPMTYGYVPQIINPEAYFSFSTVTPIQILPVHFRWGAHSSMREDRFVNAKNRCLEHSFIVRNNSVRKLKGMSSWNRSPMLLTKNEPGLFFSVHQGDLRGRLPGRHFYISHLS